MMLTLKMPADTKKHLAAVAEYTGMSEDECVTNAILVFLDEMESAKAALRRLRKPGTHYSRQQRDSDFCAITAARLLERGLVTDEEYCRFSDGLYTLRDVKAWREAKARAKKA